MTRGVRTRQTVCFSGQGAMWMRVAVLQDAGYAAVSEPLMIPVPGRGGRPELPAPPMTSSRSPEQRASRCLPLLERPPLCRRLSAEYPGSRPLSPTRFSIWTRTR